MVLKAVCSSSRCCSLRCRATSRTLVGSAPLYSVTGLTGMKISVDDWLYLSGVRRVCSGTSLAGKLGALEVRMLRLLSCHSGMLLVFG